MPSIPPDAEVGAAAAAIGLTRGADQHELTVDAVRGVLLPFESRLGGRQTARPRATVAIETRPRTSVKLVNGASGAWRSEHTRQSR